MSNTPPPLSPEASPASANAAPPKKRGIIARTLARIRLLLKLNIPLFFYLNFFCPRVHRQKGKRILPYRGTCIRIAKTARVNVGELMALNIGRHPHSKAECLIWLMDGAVWDANGYFHLIYGTKLIVYENAHLVTGHRVSLNAGSVVTCHKKITIGNNVRMAMNVFVSDSDLHPLYNSEGKRINEDRETIIEDNVWIGLKSTIMKGTRIKTGAIIGANSLVMGKIPAHTISVSTPTRPVIRDNMTFGD